MDDLISRQAAMVELGEEPVAWEMDDEYALGARDMWREAKTMLESLPSAEKHGKWIVREKDEWQTFDECVCTECGCVEYFNAGWKRFTFCPNCGARMDGE